MSPPSQVCRQRMKHLLSEHAAHLAEATAHAVEARQKEQEDKAAEAAAADQKHRAALEKAARELLAEREAAARAKVEMERHVVEARTRYEGRLLQVQEEQLRQLEERIAAAEQQCGAGEFLRV